jgi:hypothetical protein
MVFPDEWVYISESEKRKDLFLSKGRNVCQSPLWTVFLLRGSERRILPRHIMGLVCASLGHVWFSKTVPRLIMCSPRERIPERNDQRGVELPWIEAFTGSSGVVAWTSESVVLCDEHVGTPTDTLEQLATGSSTVRILREIPCWVVCRLWCGAGGMCTGGWTKGLLLVENSMTHQGVTLLHRLKTSSSWEQRVMSAPVLCTVGVVIMFYIESHWIHQNTWEPIVCCLFSGSGINAFRMVSSNSSPGEKSCTCAYIAFLAGIFSWYADST